MVHRVELRPGGARHPARATAPPRRDIHTTRAHPCLSLQAAEAERKPLAREVAPQAKELVKPCNKASTTLHIGRARGHSRRFPHPCVRELMRLVSWR